MEKLGGFLAQAKKELEKLQNEEKKHRDRLEYCRFLQDSISMIRGNKDSTIRASAKIVGEVVAEEIKKISSEIDDNNCWQWVTKLVIGSLEVKDSE